MNTTSTIATNAFDSYDSSGCALQQQTQAQYQQQHYPSLLNQNQLYEASAHSESIREKHHQTPASSMPILPHTRGQYYSHYLDMPMQNRTQNIKTKYESPSFVASAADFTKMPTNNKYANDSSLENDGYLKLIEEKSSNPSIPAEDEYSDQNEGNENVEKYDGVHENKRLVLIAKVYLYMLKTIAVERRRRNNINDNIRSLGLLLPEDMCQGKLNKGTILQGSVMYIHMLNDQLSKYKERLEHLKYEVAALNLHC
ncbi:hypothetical protein G6F42_014727 [Rhizopus arrhizus]|nr:hypothetical protein G6F42_014727 [Rhizopus arrhizus]